MLLLSFLSEQSEFEHLGLVSAHIRVNTLTISSRKITYLNIYHVLLKFEVGLQNEICVVGDEGLIVCI